MARMRKKYEEWQARLGTTNFDPLEAIDLAEAIKERKSEVTLNGVKYLLEYKENDKVLYKPERGFFPVGWIDISRLDKGY